MADSLPLAPTFWADAEDRRAALNAAVALSGFGSCHYEDCDSPGRHTIHQASEFYRWLRARDTLRATSVQLIPGIPFPEGTTPMDTTFTMPDNDEVVFTLGGVDSKNAAVAAPADTWNYTLTDPDASGAVLTPSGDTLSATVAAGTPTANLVLNVAGANTGLSANVAITVTAGEPVGVELVPGAPSAE